MSVERKGQEHVEVEERRKAAVPRRFKVLLYNDDYTSMDFVVEILEAIFRKTPAEAVQLMLKVHKEGQAIAGIYPRDVAETKVLQVHETAREAGYPLRSGMEEE